jgi:hypothetical protein
MAKVRLSKSGQARRRGRGPWPEAGTLITGPCMTPGRECRQAADYGPLHDPGSGVSGSGVSDRASRLLDHFRVKLTVRATGDGRRWGVSRRRRTGCAYSRRSGCGQRRPGSPNSRSPQSERRPGPSLVSSLAATVTSWYGAGTVAPAPSRHRRESNSRADGLPKRALVPDKWVCAGFIAPRWLPVGNAFAPPTRASSPLSGRVDCESAREWASSTKWGEGR